MSKSARPFLAATLILLLTLASIAVLSKYAPYLEILELKNYDVLLAVVRGPREPPENIVLVAIDDRSINEFLDSYDVSYPWPRSFYAELVHQLNRAGARAIVFDVLFEGKSVEEEDAAFAEAIENSRIPVVLAAAIEVVDDPRFSMVSELRPLELLTEGGARVGFATLNPDRDGVVRHGRLLVGGEPTLSVSAYENLRYYLNLETIPIAGSEGDDPEILINYSGGNRNLPTVSYYQALDFETSLPPGLFAGKVVFVGYSRAVADITTGSGANYDHYPSPFDLLGSAATMPGVEIHANIFDTLQTEAFISRLSPVATWLMVILLAILISLLVLRVNSFLGKILGSLGLIVAFWLFTVFAFLWANHWIYAVQPMVIMLTVFGLNTLYQYRMTEKERAHIRRALSGYVSREVMDEILQNPDQLELGGVQVEATVLFSDIAGFSKISENISPRELAGLLNDYFTRMGDAIMARDGMINKYIGDAIMAIWNTPLANPKHAVKACEAALAMVEIVRSMAPLEMRIGINTGNMVAGNLGHRERMEYTVIGDAVNLASRLEGANKAFGTSILINESTEALVRGQFHLRRVDRIRVVGKEKPVEVFEVLAAAEQPVPEKLEALLASFDVFNRAYDDRDWKQAEALIREHVEKFNHDAVAHAYLERCAYFLAEPPADDWDGVFTLTAK
jgi:adenylate cyclase